MTKTKTLSTELNSDTCIIIPGTKLVQAHTRARPRPPRFPGVTKPRLHGFVCVCRFVTHSFTFIFCEYRKHLRITRLRHILRVSVSVCASHIACTSLFCCYLSARPHIAKSNAGTTTTTTTAPCVRYICACSYTYVCVLYLYFINQLNTRELAPPQQQQPPQTTAPLGDDNAFNHNNNNATTKPRLREQTNNTQKKHTNNLVYVNIISLYFVTASATVHAFCWRVLVCTMWV